MFMGVITGVGGGVLRDLFAGNVPYIFRKHIYATASIVGAVLYLCLQKTGYLQLAQMVSVLAVVCLRLLAAKYRWNLPCVHLGKWFRTNRSKKTITSRSKNQIQSFKENNTNVRNPTEKLNYRFNAFYAIECIMYFNGCGEKTLKIKKATAYLYLYGKCRSGIYFYIQKNQKIWN